MQDYLNGMDLGFGFVRFHFVCLCVCVCTLGSQDANISYYRTCILLNICETCTYARASVHASSRMCVREGDRVCVPFPVCLCLGAESPSKSERLSPNYLTRWWMVEVWVRGLVEEGSKRQREWMMEEGEREAPARQFPWRWAIQRHRKCLTSHPEKCPQRPTCVKGVIGHD